MKDESMQHGAAFISAAKTQSGNANEFESVPPLTVEPPFDGKAPFFFAFFLSVSYINDFF